MTETTAQTPAVAPAEKKEAGAADILGDYLERGQMPPEIIKAKIAIMGEVGEIGKSGYNSFHKYNYSTDYDVLSAVAPLMAKHGLMLDMWPVNAYQDGHGNMTVTFMMQWQHESGVMADPIPWRGLSNDKDKTQKQGDKWFNKAATSAEKYFLIKQLHLRVTLDPKEDPDKDDEMITDDVAQQIERDTRFRAPPPELDPKNKNEPNPDDEAETLGKSEARELYTALKEQLEKCKDADAVVHWGTSNSDELESLPKEWRDELYALYRKELTAHNDNHDAT